ncbi:MAG: HAMP domain-containing protein [Ignavibacteriae bacterium]|nr:MAG: HAMP domain-containing protein [Ignavibacteriota bacterium]
MKLSLLSRIFIFDVFFTVLALVVVWVFLRPQYEDRLITEHRNSLRQMQSYALADLDQIIAGWSDVTKFIAAQVNERPKEGEIVLRSMVALHPEIVQIKIHSPQLVDELSSQNTLYPPPHVQVMDSNGIRSNVDSLLMFYWAQDSLDRQHYLVTRTNIQVENHPFNLTVIWDAKELVTVFSKLPFGEGYSASIRSVSSVLLEHHSSFKPLESRTAPGSEATVQRVRQDKSDWSVLTGAFRTAQLWLVVAVPEQSMLLPVEELLRAITVCIIGLAFIVLLLGWILSSQIKRPVRRLVRDVQNLHEMDFTQTIQVPAIKDLRGMGEALEQLRQMMELNMPPREKSEGQESDSEPNV